ncbi:MAG: Holliday junction resolvase RuvX [Patescibacteria group bacterium]
MLLGIDYGSKRIGVAFVEEGSRVVLPLKEIENKNKDFVLSEIKKIIVEKDVKTIVVGLPLSLTGERGPKAQETQKFIDFLAASVSVPVKIVDERMTSRAADVLGAGTKGSRDIGAAMVILENYIERNPKL